MRTIEIVDYDPTWPETFEQLRKPVWDVVGDFALCVEHVGSTSVPGLAAKPVIDMSVVVPSEADVPRAIKRLATLGYRHRGNLGIEGREAFFSPPDLPRHHLYVCPQGSLGLRNHLAVRDYLRTHPDAAQEYGALKKRLAQRYPKDIDRYLDGKTDFITAILREVGLTEEEVEGIEESNRVGD